MHARLVRWISVGALTVALAAWGWWETRPQAVEVSVVKADRGLVEKSVSNTRAGTVEACRRARLSPGTGGQIASLPVAEGDEVAAGDLLLELWNRDLAAQVRLTRQEADAARATGRASCIQAQQARREAERLQRLGARKLVSDDEVEKVAAAADAADAACEAARATARVSEARIAVVEATLQKTRLYAPFPGIIAEINGELNEYVTPSPPGIATPPAIDLIDNSCFYVTAPIDEVDVAAVSVGQAAHVTLDAFGEERLAGHVSRISSYVLDLEKQARTVEVEVRFGPGTDLTRLLAGYSADVQIILRESREAVRVPSEAVIENSSVYVFAAQRGVIERREVETGIGNWDHTEITRGLEPGELVVTNVDAEGLEDGADAVRKKED